MTRLSLTAARRVALVGLVLLMVGWVLGQPRWSGPDETSHYTKAMASARGQWLGRAPQRQHSFGDETTRSFSLPTDQDVLPVAPCFAFHAATPASCPGTVLGHVAVTPSGTYSPYVYALIGLPAVDLPASSGLYVARLTCAALCLLLLYGALACVDTRRGLLAVLVAACPMAVWLGSVLNPNGVEVAGAIGFASATLAVAAGRQHWVWWALSGASLALAKSLTPFWIVAILLLGLVVAKNRKQLIKDAPIWAGVVVAAAFLAQVAWTVLVMPHPDVPLSVLRHNLPGAVRSAKGFLLDDTVGRFGWLDVMVPLRVSHVVDLVLALAAVAFLVKATTRFRLVLLGWLLLCLLATVYVTAGIELPIGLNGQVRFTLALVAVTPLIVAEGWPGKGSRVLAAAGVGLAVLQVYAWWVDARRYAVGVRGPFAFLGHPHWSPVAGWTFPLLLVVLGGLAVGTSVVVSEDRQALAE